MLLYEVLYEHLRKHSLSTSEAFHLCLWKWQGKEEQEEDMSGTVIRLGISGFVVITVGP